MSAAGEAKARRARRRAMREGGDGGVCAMNGRIKEPPA